MRQITTFPTQGEFEKAKACVDQLALPCEVVAPLLSALPEDAKPIDLAHSLGMKAILYAATGFFEATDPDFNPEWADPKAHLVEMHFDYAQCSPAHPGWRAYILPRLERVITEYGVNGLYDDMGYFPLHGLNLDPTAHIRVSAYPPILHWTDKPIVHYSAQPDRTT